MSSSFGSGSGGGGAGAGAPTDAGVSPGGPFARGVATGAADLLRGPNLMPRMHARFRVAPGVRSFSRATAPVTPSPAPAADAMIPSSSAVHSFARATK